jgi:hypothetical protein
MELGLDRRGFPPGLRGVEELTNRLLADRGVPPVGKNWVSDFNTSNSHWALTHVT